jgi:Tol biopolymer transport system component
MVSDEIVLGSQGRFLGLSHVSATGGETVGLTQPDTARGEQHLWPIGLPDGRTIVFTIWTGTLTTSRLAITSLADGRVVPLGIAGIRPLAVLDGMLVYLQADGTVMAVALDARGKRLRGRPIPVHDPVPVKAENNGNSGIFVSRGGALVTSRGGTLGRLSWVSLDGRAEPVLPQVRSYEAPRVSPDERRIAVIVREESQGDAWIYDRALLTFSRLSSTGSVTSVEWSRDGSRVLFTSAGGTHSTVWSQAISGGSPPDKLTEVGELTPDVTMSPDGNTLLMTSLPPVEPSWNILRVSLDSEHVTREYLATKAGELSPRFSPDGRWVAITSDESGPVEVYVRSFPDPASRIQVSLTGGSEPAWSRDGTRL